MLREPLDQRSIIIAANAVGMLMETVDWHSDEYTEKKLLEELYLSPDEVEQVLEYMFDDYGVE